MVEHKLNFGQYYELNKRLEKLVKINKFLRMKMEDNLGNLEGINYLNLEEGYSVLLTNKKGERKVEVYKKDGEELIDNLEILTGIKFPKN